MLTGVAGTLIPAGSQAQTINNDLFELQSDVTLDVSGNGTGNFVALVAGAIPCGADTLNQIVSLGVTGWETVNNPSAGTVGQGTQSDAQYRAYRKNTIAFQGVGLIECIASSLYATEGVKSIALLEKAC